MAGGDLKSVLWGFLSPVALGNLYPPHVAWSGLLGDEGPHQAESDVPAEAFLDQGFSFSVLLTYWIK